jgi:hypothetical protein
MSGKYSGAQRLVARGENLTNEAVAYRAIRELVQVPGMVRMSPAEVVWAVKQLKTARAGEALPKFPFNSSKKRDAKREGGAA